MRKRTNREGSALIMAIIAFIILAGIGAAFFSFALAQSDKTSKASTSDSVLHIAEAGIDDVINKMSAYASLTSIPSGADWTALDPSAKITDADSSSGFVHRLTGSVNGGSYTVVISPHYDVTLPNQVYKLTSSASNPNKGKEVRGIECYVNPIPVGNAFDYGLFGDVFVDAGGGTFADSYKSSAGDYADQDGNTITVGGKSYNYALTNGNIGSNGDVEVGGSAVIMGNATPGPDGTYTNQGGGYVNGSTAALENPVELTPQVYPSTLASAAALMSSLPVVNGTMGNNDTITLAGGSFQTDTLKFGQSTTLKVTGKTVLYIDGSVQLNAGDQIIMDGPDASLTIYHKAGDVTLNGHTWVNGADPKPVNFQFYSSTQDTIRINGSSDVYGVVYAPEATYENNGTAPVYGAIVAGTINILGDAVFHYDEDIDISPNPVINYKIKSWKEVRP